MADTEPVIDQNQPGLPPGALLKSSNAAIPGGVTVTRIGQDSTSEQTFHTAKDAIEFAREHKEDLLWVDIAGLGDLDMLGAIAKEFHLHPLAVEDSVNISERAKIENYGDMLFVALKLPHATERGIRPEQISLFLLSNTIVSFQEMRGDSLGAVRMRIQNGSEFFQTRGADYLLSTMIDDIVDNCFPCLNALAEREESLEDQVTTRAERPSIVNDFFKLQRDLRDARRAIWPMRDALSSLCRDQFPNISPDTRPFFRDALDHIIQIMETLDNEREAVNGLIEMHSSILSNRMNEIMKVLTVISTIFIPLTFITSLYGMNFQFMPELKSPLGYPVCLCVMLLLAFTLFQTFRRLGWIGTPSEDSPKTKRKSAISNVQVPARNGGTQQDLLALSEYLRLHKKTHLPLPHRNPRRK
ncbi:MAG: magnesium/cobalt transporter CorA [Victivallales bacterium]|nr:magnesium/cobalt transporter CorA [Victivallales bacterium]